MRSWLRLIQALWLLLAAAFFVSASLLHRPLDAQGERLGLAVPGNVVGRNYPELTLLSWMPGGLRAPVVTYQWIRAQSLDQQGRYFDALERARMICALQPKFASNWDYQAWNMAWNISVMTHTPQERWKWIYNGITLLRDQGIPANPKAQKLYQSLGWIFYSKIGGDTDEMNLTYKERWAGIMQQLLGAPPAGETPAVIDAFRPIADPRLLDKGRAPAPERPIQADRLAQWLRDNPDAAELSKELADRGVGVDRGLLEAYNRFSEEYPASIVRLFPPRASSKEEQALQTLLHDGKKAPALHKLLAFVRAQLLYNEFKMDPQFMLGMMEKFLGKYQVPLDWRIAQAHGMYWSLYGIVTCNAKGLADIDALTSDRIVLYCLKELTWYGKMSVIENPSSPDYPDVTRMSDLRFIQPAHEQALDFIHAVAPARQEKFGENTFSDGHRNYLKTCIQMLVPAGKVKQAQDLFDWIKREYQMTGGEWDIQDVRDWTWWAINNEGKPILAAAKSQITSALQTAFALLAVGDRESMKDYQEMMHYAKATVYDTYQKQAVPRNRLEPFESIAAVVLLELLIEPRNWGQESLYPLTIRSELYKALQTEWPTVLPMIYDIVARPLMVQCQWYKVDFNKAFPPPDGLEEYRAKRGGQFRPGPRVTN